MSAVETAFDTAHKVLTTQGEHVGNFVGELLGKTEKPAA
jgi:hypothetical protein